MPATAKARRPKQASADSLDLPCHIFAGFLREACDHMRWDEGMLIHVFRALAKMVVRWPYSRGKRRLDPLTASAHDLIAAERAFEAATELYKAREAQARLVLAEKVFVEAFLVQARARWWDHWRCNDGARKCSPLLAIPGLALAVMPGEG